MRFSLLIGLLFIIGCSSSKTYTVEDFNRVKGIATNDFKLDVTVAYPFNTNATNQVLTQVTMQRGDSPNRINLSGESVTFELRNDSLFTQLPFYGEQRLSTRYMSNPGIVVEAPISDNEIIINEEKKMITRKFNASGKDENHEFVIEFLKHGFSKIYVTSTSRTFMNYDAQLVDQ